MQVLFWAVKCTQTKITNSLTTNNCTHMPLGVVLIMALGNAIIIQLNKQLCVLSSYRNYLVGNGVITQ